MILLRVVTLFTLLIARAYCLAGDEALLAPGQSPPPCCSPDLIFLVDVTDGAGFSDDDCKNDIRSFFNTLIKKIAPEACNDVRGVVIEYGNYSRIRFDFNKYPTTDALKTYFLTYTQGNVTIYPPSNATAAFKAASFVLNTPTRGHRPDAPVFVFWLLKSTPVDATLQGLQQTVDALESMHNIYVSVIAVGRKVSWSKVSPYATSPNFFFGVSDLSVLTQSCDAINFNYCATTPMATVATVPTPKQTTQMTAATTPTTTTTTKKQTPSPTTTKTTTKATTKAAQTTIANPPIPTQFPPTDATSFCFQCRNRRNHKDLYADTTECHHYYQCLYLNDTFATGIRRVCPSGTFWHDSVLQCMPEGATACVDRCMTDATHAIGYYAGDGCRQFFICANTASYGMCCPLGTAFNSTNGNCDESSTCQDACSQQGPQVPTTVHPPSFFNDTVCRDSWGTLISIVAEAENAFTLLDENGDATVTQFCPTGISFNLMSCRCDIENGITAPPAVVLRQAILWIPFDVDAKDHSVNKWATFLYDGAFRDTSTSAIGGGSLNVFGGHVSIPGLKTFDLQAAASWCAFFRCESSSGNQCTASGGILSNNKDAASTEFTVILAVEPTNTFTGLVNLWPPAGEQTVNGAISPPANGWNHVCVTYNGHAVKLYLNGALSDTVSISGYLSIAHCPYVIGNDQSFGEFNGHIDDVLITQFEMTVSEINAHRIGNRTYLSSLGFF